MSEPTPPADGRPMHPLVEHDPWIALRRHTPARIAQGRTGASQGTAEQLRFMRDHARARDAVHTPLDVDALCADLRAIGVEPVVVDSAAGDRATYLMRPDLGRRLSDAGRERLAAVVGEAVGATPPDLLFVIGDGLSSLAVARHAVPMLAASLACLPDWRTAPVVVVARQARVALGDEIAERMGAGCVAMLIGERPGLTTPDSLGLYLTWAPRVGRRDAERNCISGIRPEGLAVERAARTLAGLLTGARRLQATGVALKDESCDEVRLGRDAGPTALPPA